MKQTPDGEVTAPPDGPNETGEGYASREPYIIQAVRGWVVRLVCLPATQPQTREARVVPIW